MSLRLVHVARPPEFAGIDRYSHVKTKQTFGSLIEYRTVTLIVHKEVLPAKESRFTGNVAMNNQCQGQ